MPKKIFSLLCGPRLLNYILPIVMGYLFVGTVAQKYIGLYQATQIFFSAPILWLGFVPLPGLPIFMGLIFLNLAFKLIFKSPWTRQNSGIIITHIGIMMLLLGGLFTALFSHEGYIALDAGKPKNIVSDYHTREFVVLDHEDKKLTVRDFKDIQTSSEIIFDALPFSFEVLEACKNCKITAREEANENHKGMAQHMQLSADTLKKNDEENMSGLTLKIKHETVQDIFVVLEDIPKYPQITLGEKTYRFALRRQHRTLPFSIELLDFKKEMHPGTDMAKSYQSTVLIKDGDSQWESTISMNAPLRYRGYTFFQSSFIKTPQGDISVLAAVWNAGRTFPYISGLAMCIGLLLHLFVRNTTKRRKQKHA